MLKETNELDEEIRKLEKRMRYKHVEKEDRRKPLCSIDVSLDPIEPNERYTEIMAVDRMLVGRDHTMHPYSDGYQIKGNGYTVNQWTGTVGYYGNQVEVCIDGCESIGYMSAREAVRCIEAFTKEDYKNE